MQAKANNPPPNDFAFGERIINYIRWPLIGLFLLFNNLGFTENADLVLVINGVLLLALLLTGYIQYRLHRGHSFGKGITLALSAIQDALIMTGVYLTGLYDSHFYIFFYPSLLGFSLAFSLRASLIYTSLVGLVYVAACWFLTPGMSGDLVTIKVLVERWLVLYLIVFIGGLLVQQERRRRIEAVAAERRMGQKNEQAWLDLQARTERWQAACREIDRSASQIDALAQELAKLGQELASGRQGIETSIHELIDRAATQSTQVNTIGGAAGQMTASASDLSESAGSTGIASERAQGAVVQATESIQALGQRSQAVGQLAATIREVADQTNLLAFNANIEAIQAGQKGQRFAVVADEVRLVAERAISLAREIDELSYELQQGTRQTLDAMSEIAGMVEQTTGLVQAASQASRGQQASTGQVVQAVHTLQDLGRRSANDVQAVVTAVRHQDLALQRMTAISQQIADSAGGLDSLGRALLVQGEQDDGNDSPARL